MSGRAGYAGVEKSLPQRLHDHFKTGSSEKLTIKPPVCVF
jgi:hypothetical protein